MCCRVAVPLLVVTAFGYTPHSPDTPERVPPEPGVVMSDRDSLPIPSGLDGLPIVLKPVDPVEVVNSAPPDLDSAVEAYLPELERAAEKAVDAAVTTDNLGRPTDPDLLPTFLRLPRAAHGDDPPAKEKAGAGAFAGRSGEAKAKLVKEAGANEASERAVALGLAWLAKQQKQDGGWEFDQGGWKEERVAATGLALLAFLGAGETHTTKVGKYRKTVDAGLNYLRKNAGAGVNAGKLSGNTYSQGIATLALCEAYGMTQDAALKPVVQSVVNYLQKIQAPNGSWGYGPIQNGDTSIVGWQLQALYAAKQAKGLVVDDKVLKKAVAFLDLTAAGAKKSMYGYADSAGARPGTALTAVGLLSRARLDGWGPDHPGTLDGVAGLMKNSPRGKGGVADLYYYYYATQVLRLAGGDDWATWNEGPKDADGTRAGGLRDWLVKAQVTKEGANLGSWEPEAGWFGTSCGRLGTTAVCVLNLEVYYRCLPPEKGGK